MDFDWQCHPQAEKILYSLLDQFKQKNSVIAELEHELFEKTSTRLFDWVDYLILNEDHGLIKLGFEEKNGIFSHSGAKFPDLIINKNASLGVALKVESIADFLMVRGIHREIEGSPFSPFRRCLIHREQDVDLFVVERRGQLKREPLSTSFESYLIWMEKWQTRDRESMEEALQIAKEMISVLGQDLSAWLVCECERKYWQARNAAAQVQKNRQDRLGMGWANHDHHTFRSSRRHFVQLVQLFERLGFQARERFYAGKQAGWGAQIMENANCGLILFLDVDLSPDELEIDFAHHPLPERDFLGTVGIWCELHGDSILKAGMHHLEAQFDFDRLKGDLEKTGVGMMDPFSNFTYLRQAFTKAEIWSVNPHRIERLLDQKLITEAQAKEFLKKGAVGSHLENLQRKEGYKGFNKDNVSLIIKKTDPRVLH